MVYRIYVEKKDGFDSRKDKLLGELKVRLGIDARLRILLGYDFEGEREHFLKAADTVFSTPPSDVIYIDEMPNLNGFVLAVSLLEGQYDQRADSCGQCIQMLTSVKPKIRCFTVYAFENITKAEFERVKAYIINPVESREITLDMPDSLDFAAAKPGKEKQISGFKDMDNAALKEFYSNSGFSFSFDDAVFIRDYFASLKRNPYEVELRVLDAYWSDHCRHTTFNTILSEIKVDSNIPLINETLQVYKDLLNKYYGGKRQASLMSIATIGAKELEKSGFLPYLDKSEEINACSIKVRANVDGAEEDWLVMFKNETHNHPTEIEPYGGAATCLGGAIRDPLSGRTYVYQAMRVSGAGNINTPLNETLKGKLPQCVIAQTAASGFSSYGNQIGLATGLVKEFYHPGYVAKRLETGFVAAAAPAKNVVRMRPEAGDIIMLIGGGTGRDGLGGATGSSKTHKSDSILTCGAEVQKGNPVTERKLQRLFKNPDFSVLVKRCNDFGAGGVSVAVGELSDGVDINLDAVPKKYSGLSGLELALSESQERMAVVISPENEAKVHEFCNEENLSSSVIAQVTGLNKMRMFFGGELIVDLDREFLDTNGAAQTQNVLITDKAPDVSDNKADIPDNIISDNIIMKSGFEERLASLLSNGQNAGQKGLVEMFDSTIGAATLLMPFGGKYQSTPSAVMAAKLPVSGQTDTATVSSYGFNPYLSEKSPFIGAVCAVATSVIKVAVAGADYNTIHLTFQEFFEKLKTEPSKWGKCASALLGALHAQLKLKKAAIGGKDSMSGSFLIDEKTNKSVDVPPTLISFALGVAKDKDIIHNVLTKNLNIYRFSCPRDKNGIPDLDALNSFLIKFNAQKSRVKFAAAVEEGGALCTLTKSALGNRCGFTVNGSPSGITADLPCDILFGIDAQGSNNSYSSADSSSNKENIENGCALFAISDDSGVISFNGAKASVEKLEKAYYSTYSAVYPLTGAGTGKEVAKCNYSGGSIISRAKAVAKPKALIPVFPGTNCELDTVRAFEGAGAEAEAFVIKNLTSADIAACIPELVKRIKSANILCLPGGFSGGDEPDGSAKFICSTLINPYVADAINELLYKRDGLILGICNGFQALIKLGLLPYGKIEPLKSDSPTLTFNTIPRHISCITRVRVASNLSPWFNMIKTGQVFNQAISHGEGRFIANETHLKRLINGNQIATQYADVNGNPTNEPPFNPNGSANAIEGIISPDGRILGKMGHAERVGSNLYRNIDGEFDMKIFASGVNYYK